MIVIFSDIAMNHHDITKSNQNTLMLHWIKRSDTIREEHDIAR